MHATFTLTMLRAELDRLGIVIQAAGDRLRFRPRGAVSDELLAALRQHKPELLAVLTAPNAGDWRQNPPIPAKNEGTVAVATRSGLENDVPDSLPDWVFAVIDVAFPIGGAGAKTSTADMPARYRREWTPWQGADAALIQWFRSHRDRLPREPFQLFSWATIGDPAKFYAVLERDAEAGPNCARAAGLLNELHWLRQLF